MTKHIIWPDVWPLKHTCAKLCTPPRFFIDTKFCRASHRVAPCRTMSHRVAPSRTMSHRVAACHTVSQFPTMSHRVVTCAAVVSDKNIRWQTGSFCSHRHVFTDLIEDQWSCRTLGSNIANSWAPKNDKISPVLAKYRQLDTFLT